VLFWTSCPSFRAALEALREPLESGRIHISRAARRAEFPARFQLVAAMNPCPCGHLGARAGSGQPACRCTPDQVARYQGRLSGPLLDRIDLHVEVPQLAPDELLAAPPAKPAPPCAHAAWRRASGAPGHAQPGAAGPGAGHTPAARPGRRRLCRHRRRAPGLERARHAPR
jgi:magnesium chelatase family protein